MDRLWVGLDYGCVGLGIMGGRVKTAAVRALEQGSKRSRAEEQGEGELSRGIRVTVHGIGKRLGMVGVNKKGVMGLI